MKLRRLRRWLSLDESPVGRGLSAPAGAVMAALALLVTALDLQLLPWSVGWRGFERMWPALAVVAVFALLARGRLDAIGARLAPLPNLGYWIRSTVVLAALFAVILAVAFAIFLAIGIDVTVPPPAPAGQLWLPLVDAPITEEVIYRWALVTGLVALGPRWFAVLVSGATFGYLHFLYGTPGANNVAAGFVFAWMYLRSGSILVPIAFHSLGNLTVWVLNLIAFQLA